jgi:hypothetical protein
MFASFYWKRRTKSGILQKVVLMMGIFDGCRDELFKMMINDAEDNFEVVNPTLVVKIPIT